MQNYNTIEEKASEWNVSTRHIQYLCRQGKVEGAVKRAGSWFIPEDAPIPIKNIKKGLNHYEKNFKFIGTKDKIFGKAIELFLTKGFNNVSCKDIAANLGIRQATIYNYFKSKQEILDTIYNFYCHHYLEDRIEQADLQEIIAEKSPLEIVGYIRYEFNEKDRERMLAISKIIFQRIGVDDRAKEIAKSLIIDEGIGYVETVLNAAVKAGRFAPFDTHIMAVFINAVRIFTLYYWMSERSDDERRRLIEDELALYKYALGFLVDLKYEDKSS